jgi:hypothetical protein
VCHCHREAPTAPLHTAFMIYSVSNCEHNRISRMPEHTDHGEARVGASRSMYQLATLSSMAGAALRNTSLRRAELSGAWPASRETIPVSGRFY